VNTKLATTSPIGFFFVIHIREFSIEIDQISNQTLLAAVNDVDFYRQPVSAEFFVYNERKFINKIRFEIYLFDFPFKLFSA
jgi:hypothetical protein